MATTIKEEQDEIREEFDLFDDPKEKLEYILDLGRSLPELDERHKVEENRVRGCQSQVWMIADLDQASGRMRLEADSDAFIVKGLITLLLRLYSNRPPEEVLANPPQVFEDIGLGKMLTPGRANGLYSMINRIQHLADAFQKAAAGPKATAG